MFLLLIFALIAFSANTKVNAIHLGNIIQTESPLCVYYVKIKNRKHFCLGYFFENVKICTCKINEYYSIYIYIYHTHTHTHTPSPPSLSHLTVSIIQRCPYPNWIRQLLLTNNYCIPHYDTCYPSAPPPLLIHLHCMYNLVISFESDLI